MRRDRAVEALSCEALFRSKSRPSLSCYLSPVKRVVLVYDGKDWYIPCNSYLEGRRLSLGSLAFVAHEVYVGRSIRNVLVADESMYMAFYWGFKNTNQLITA